MREPYFWSVTEKRSRASAPMTKLLLSPLAMAYRIAGERRIRSTTPEDVGLPVVCIGNLTLGGAGKTPVTEAVRTHYAGRGLRAASLSRASLAPYSERSSSSAPERSPPALAPRQEWTRTQAFVTAAPLLFAVRDERPLRASARRRRGGDARG